MDFEPEKLEGLYLASNKLKNINFVKHNTPFINLERLYINNTKLINITNIKYLVNLVYLDISYLDLENEKETIKTLKLMNNIQKIWCWNTFKNYTYKQLTNIPVFYTF